MSVIEGGFNHGTIVLHLSAKRVLILRSRGEVERLKMVGEPINTSTIDDRMHVSSTGWLMTQIIAVLGRLHPDNPLLLVRDDPRIAGYDFLIVAPPDVEVTIASAKHHDERWID